MYPDEKRHCLKQWHEKVKIPPAAIPLDLSEYPLLHSDPFYTRSLLFINKKPEHFSPQLSNNSKNMAEPLKAKDSMQDLFHTYSLQYFFYLKLTDLL